MEVIKMRSKGQREYKKRIDRHKKDIENRDIEKAKTNDVVKAKTNDVVKDKTVEVAKDKTNKKITTNKDAEDL